MSEIYKNTSQFVYLDVYGGVADDTPVAQLVASDGTLRDLVVSQDTPPTGVDDRYHVSLTMADTQNEGTLDVNWTFSIQGVPTGKTDTFEVVTPYLTTAQVKSIWPEASDSQAQEVESIVRHIINAHTGQSFGYGAKSLTIQGHGENALRLPERLITLTGLRTLTSNLNTNAVIITSDGWYLKKSWAESVGDALTSDSQYWGDYQGGVFDNSIYIDPDGDGEPPLEGPVGVRPGRVITAPGTWGRSTPWAQDYPFVITGVWGYKTVPAPVVEAAKLLVNDYACNEIIYRDRYLDSIKASDWRLQFSSRAWEYTGNVRADQLLAEFVLLDWAVI